MLLFHWAKLKLAVLALILVVAGIVWAVLGSYQQRFDDWVRVTVIADRTGLVMDRGARVSMTGVQVGEVTGIDYHGDQARLSLRLHRSSLASIPANVDAQITSTTVFGAKYVSLNAPATAASTARLAAGATIDISHVTVEINTVFEQLTDLMRAVDPAQLEATLGALATALQGRGERLGTAIDHASAVLTQLNAADPGIGDLLRTAAPTSTLYGDISPELMRTLSALTSTGTTITDKQQQLAKALSSATTVADTGSDLLAHNGSQLADVLRLLAPTSSLAAEYAPEIPCLFQGITASNTTNPDAYAGQPGVKMFAGLTPGVSPYKYPDDLPKVNATGGPHCLGLPYTDPVEPAPYVVTDTGVNPFDPSRQGVGLRQQPSDLVGYLFGLGGDR
ncbi:Mce family protein MceA [Nocardia nova SH22a]|uniref:Mce family protein MceA n=1 Tax=Nocardia nova SH22a TaxID=1415166 RepID=W5TFE2_9NOCA|nr:MCE family protein [Nocardia nova]AHH18075.1 Mce family protein MceA [Nocardia nova SH22a]